MLTWTPRDNLCVDVDTERVFMCLCGHQERTYVLMWMPREYLRVDAETEVELPDGRTEVAGVETDGELRHLTLHHGVPDGTQHLTLLRARAARHLLLLQWGRMRVSEEDLGVPKGIFTHVLVFRENFTFYFQFLFCFLYSYFHSNFYS